MPFSITCPLCWATLKTKAAIPSGRSVECPKCKKRFDVTPENMFEAGPVKLTASDPPPARKTSDRDNPSRGHNAPAVGNNRRGDNPRHDQAPMSLDDANQKLRPRHPMPLDDENPKPRPRRPMPLDDDDDNEFRPRETSKKQSLGVIAAICLIALVGLSGAGYLVYSRLIGRADTNKTGPSAGVETDHLMSMAFLPAETNVLGYIDVEGLMNNDKFKGLVKQFAQTGGYNEFADKLKEAGLTEDDVSSIVAGGKMELESKPSPGKKEDQLFVFVFRFKRSVDKGKITKAMEVTEQKSNDKTFYKSVKPDNHLFVFFPSDSSMVLAPSEKQIDSITANSGKLAISDEMQALAKNFDKGQFWFCFSRALVEDKLKEANDFKAGIPGVPADAAVDLLEAVKSMRGAGGYVKLEGEKLTFGLGLLCSDSTVASKATQALEKFVKTDSNNNSPLKMMSALVPPELKNVVNDVLQSINVSSSDALMELSASMAVSNLQPLMKMMGGQQGVAAPPAAKQPKSVRPSTRPKK